jgi:ABC-2 type transport system ATP-binding protein
VNSEQVILTRNLTKYYKDFWGRSSILALRDLNLSVSRGEIFGLLGPNGSGKTTTIKLLLGLLRPTSGFATLFGKPASDVEVKQRIGYLPEENSLYGFLTAAETMRFLGSLFSLSRSVIEERTDSLFSTLGLSDVRDRKVGKFSKGMVRRLSLAVALVNDPELLILDEPTSGLDPLGAKSAKELFLNLKKSDKTILLSSHLLGDVEDVCDSIAILDSGRLVQAGKVSELLTIRDEIEIRLRADLSQADNLRGLLKSSGAEVVSVRNPALTLEDLFIKTIAPRSSPPRNTAGREREEKDRL